MLNVRADRVVADSDGLTLGLVVQGDGGWVQFALLLLPWNQICRRDVLDAILAEQKRPGAPPPEETLPLF